MVATVSKLHGGTQHVDELGDDYLRNLGAFWTQYNALRGEKFQILGMPDPGAAVAAVRRTQT